MRLLATCLATVLAGSASLSCVGAELPPLGDQAPAWARSVGKGAVATAEKRDGKWTFAIAGEPFATPKPDVPAEKVLFEIGSISKVFTGLVLAHAVHEGKLSLDDTLGARLPVKFDDPAVGAVTLRQLATHSSCLPRLPDNMTNAAGDDPYAQYDERAMFEYLAHAKLDGTAPCKASYSNLGVGILGVVLEHALGKPWAALVQDAVTGPLGMTDTVQVLSEAQAARFADPWSGAEAAHPWTFRAIAGAGALRSDLADMSRLADALLAGSKGPLADVWPIFAGDYVDMPALGGKIGLAILHAKDAGDDSYFHGGGTGGYRTEVRVYPETGRAAIVLASNAEAHPEAWIPAWRKGDAATPERKEISVDPASLDEYAGIYAIDAQGSFTIVRHGDGLMARLTAQPFVTVVPSAKDEFFYKVVDAQLSFRRDATGKLTGLTLHQNGRDIQAERSAAPVPHFEFPSPQALAEYAGAYDFGQFQPGASITITAPGSALVVQLTGQPALPVACIGKDRFAYDVVEASLVFERDAAGKVVAVVLHQGGAEMRAPRK